jgi:hypothetical protein
MTTSHPDDRRPAVDAAHVAAEAVRALNHATMPARYDDAGPVNVTHVYEILAQLTLMAARLPQALAQVDAILAREVDARRVKVVDGEHLGNPEAAAAVVEHRLAAARNAAEQLGNALGAAQQTLAWAARDDTSRRLV